MMAGMSFCRGFEIVIVAGPRSAGSFDVSNMRKN
jgi:hypothetical protein